MDSNASNAETFWGALGDDDLEYLGVADGEIVIRCVQLDGIVRTIALQPEAIVDGDIEDVLDALRGKRPLKVLKHLSRIVGYYSELGNWNRSKLAERKARERGNYALKETG